MGNPSGSRGEAAYARAMAAFQEGSLDVAKRLVTEALSDDPHDPGAVLCGLESTRGCRQAIPALAARRGAALRPRRLPSIPTISSTARRSGLRSMSNRPS